MKIPFFKTRFSIHRLRDGTKRRRRWSSLTRWQKIKYGFLTFFGACLTLSLGLFAWIMITLPDIDDHSKMFAAQSSVILDRNGVVLYKITGDEDREIVPFNKISKYAGMAAISIEDDRFYEHPGFDIPAILKALCSEANICSQARGGSTITQQYIKNTFLTNEQTYTRKAKEIILAMQLENRYSKDEILALYLNRIPYGGTVYGIEVASKKFFGKSAADLSIAESAILAALPKSPTYYSPYGENLYPKILADEETILKEDFRTEQDIVDADINYISKGLLGKTYTFGEGDQKRDIYVKGRVEFVLERMRDLGHITEEEMNSAQIAADNMQFQPVKDSLEKAPHFVKYVQQQLEDPEKYGETRVREGGLKITTTLDYEMQKMAEETIAEFAERNLTNYQANNESLIAIDPRNGQILAMVGSKDFNSDEISGQTNMTTTTSKQPGSSFKPFVYAAAFLKGHAPSTIVYDIELIFDKGTAYEYKPNNYNGKFNGPVSIRTALGGSLNIPAIKAGQAAGMENVLKMAESFGMKFQANPSFGPAAAIGTNDVSLLDMARGYSVFANGGYKVEPVAILKIEDNEGNILEEFKAPENQKPVLDPQVAFLVNEILTDETARPAGETWRGRLTLEGLDNGAKTGTSNLPSDSHATIRPKDNLTLGYTPTLAAGVWVGNTGPGKENAPMSPEADGLTTAAPIWREFMLKATTRVEKGEYPPEPEGITWVAVSKKTGQLASKKTPSGDIVKAPFASFAVPKDYDSSFQVVKVDKVSGKLATEFTPQEAIEERYCYLPHDIDPRWDKEAQAWARKAGIGCSIPTEYDDVHTAENTGEKPLITITSPRSNSMVSPPRMNVMVDVSSPAGIKHVDYYLDDQLLSTVSNSPYHGSIPFPDTFEDGSIHTIKAVVFDELLHSNQSSVTVKVGSDDSPPTVSITYPKDGKTFEPGSSVGVEFDAFDGNGGVMNAKYYLNGRLQQNDIELPFSWQLTVPEEEGEHTLKVVGVDFAGNESSDSITIEVEGSGSNNDNDEDDEEDDDQESDSGGGGTSQITSPGAHSTFAEGESVHISGQLSSSDQKDIQEVIFYAKKSGQSAQEIASVPGSSGNSSYGVTWSSPASGTYEIYMKVVTDDSSNFTAQVPIVVGIEE